MSRSVRLRLIIIALLIVLVGHAAIAHPPVPTVALVTIEAGGRVRVTIIHDGLAYALNDTSTRIGDPEMYALLNAPRDEIEAALQDGRERMAAAFQLTADAEMLPCEFVRVPTVADIDRWRLDHPGLGLPVKLEFDAVATLPPGAAAAAFRFPVVLDNVMLVVDRPGIEPTGLPLSPGEVSPAIDVRMATSALTPAPPAESGPSAAPDAPPAAADEAGAWEVARRYAVLGLEHVVPDGTDHAVFVFALFLLSPRVKSVVWQITAFTVAHTITLTLATLKLVSIPASIVEPTIALTIAFVAVENLFVNRVHPWRPLVAFIFGLVHGLGFASALTEVGLPTGQLAAGLIAFNVGVEAGHLTVLLAAFLLLGWCRGRAWYRSRIAIPLSLIIAGFAGYWAITRLMGVG